MEKYVDVESVRRIAHDYLGDKEHEAGFMSEVEGAVTADIASIKHGEWTQDEWDEIEGTGVYKCSTCKEEFVFIDGTPEENKYYFCPHCGARMDGTRAENHAQ